MCRWLAYVGTPVYLDSLIRALPKAGSVDMVYIPYGTDAKVIRDLQKGGHRTLQGLEKVATVEAEARRLGCSHFWDGKSAKSLK